MQFKKKTILLISLALAVAVVVGTVSYVFAVGGASHRYTEPATRPAGLPAEAMFNPDKNEYYDSSIVTWDSVRQRYVAKEQPVVSNPAAENLHYLSSADWIALHKDSADPIDMALIKYLQAIATYVSQHPEVGARSDLGVDYSGELSILTDLGVAGLPGLVKEVDVNNPIDVPLIIAINAICKTQIGFQDTFSPEQITAWKNSFNGELNNGKDVVTKVSAATGNGAPVNAEDINNQLAGAGIFALPYFYDEVISHSNTSLLIYADKVLPDGKLKEFNIKSGSVDLTAYMKALESCTADINVIKSLVAN